MSELYGLALRGPDGLPDLMLDSSERGRAELRVRSDGGAKGAKTRRVPITPRLAAAVKRYASLRRPESESPVGITLGVSYYGSYDNGCGEPLKWLQRPAREVGH